MKLQRSNKETIDSRIINPVALMSNHNNEASKDKHEIIFHMRQQIHALESEIKVNRDTFRLKEERLSNIANTKEHCRQELQDDFEMLNCEQMKTERALMRSEIDRGLDEIKTEKSSQRAKVPFRTLGRIISSDRQWLETEMARRAEKINNFDEKILKERK